MKETPPTKGAESVQTHQIDGLVDTTSGQQYYPDRQCPGIISATQVQRVGSGARQSFSPWAQLIGISLRLTNAGGPRLSKTRLPEQPAGGARVQPWGMMMPG